MSKLLSRYRIFKIDGTYEVIVSTSRHKAIEEALLKFNLKREDLMSISIVASRNTRIYRLDKSKSGGIVNEDKMVNQHT